MSDAPGSGTRRLAIVIVNWNTGSLLQECLASIPASATQLRDCELDEVIVVDNASTDGSADALDLEALPLSLLRNETNRGFAAACNQGANACSSDIILFLNPDTRLFAESLAVPVAHLSSSAAGNTGIVGIRHVNAEGRPVQSAATFPTAARLLAQALRLDRVVPSLSHFLPDGELDRTRSVDQVIGAFFMVRRSLFQELGGFDERFFVYFEEVDFALRALERGSLSEFVAGANVFHYEGGSSLKVKGRRLFYSWRSRLLYGEKHFTRPERALLVATTYVVEPLARLGALLGSGRIPEIADLWQGYKLLISER